MITHKELTIWKDNLMLLVINVKKIKAFVEGSYINAKHIAILKVFGKDHKIEDHKIESFKERS